MAGAARAAPRRRSELTATPGAETDSACIHRAPNATGVTTRRLALALVLTATFCSIEVAGGLWTGSLALLSDAGHMLADLLALSMSLVACRLAARPATPEKTYGFHRFEILSALANGLLLLAVAVWLMSEAYHRFGEPHPLRVEGMLGVAVMGLITNVVVLKILKNPAGHRHDLNTRAAYLHVLGDLLSSVGVVIGGVVIALTGESRVDTLIAIGIGVLLLWNAQKVVREAVHVLLEAIPRGLRAIDVERAILSTDGVVGLHDLHIWSLTTGVEALSAHVRVRAADLAEVDRILRDIDRDLRRDFAIAHSTIQIESEALVHEPPAATGHVHRSVL